MKSQRDIKDYLEDIQDAIAKIEEFTSGMDFDEFSRDKKTVFAVIRAFEVIGEATKNVPPEVRRRHPEVPWKDMAGMRDKMIHEYFAIDIPGVWKTVQQDVPTLKPSIEQLIRAETGRGDDGEG